MANGNSGAREARSATRFLLAGVSCSRGRPVPIGTSPRTGPYSTTGLGVLEKFERVSACVILTHAGFRARGVLKHLERLALDDCICGALMSEPTPALIERLFWSTGARSRGHAGAASLACGFQVVPERANT